MKNFNIVIFIIMVCMNCLFTGQAQNAENLTAAKRDSLISLSKEVILKFGPDYYREYKQPEIILRQFPSADKINDKRLIKYANRYYYRVSFPYDKTQEFLESFAAEVDICADTFMPWGVMFGNGIGRAFWDNDWRDLTLEPMKYQEILIPRYPPIEIEIPDSIWGQPQEIIDAYSKEQIELIRSKGPANKDELLKRGWEERNGEWVKVRPDVPPHKRTNQF